MDGYKRSNAYIATQGEQLSAVDKPQASCILLYFRVLHVIDIFFSSLSP